MKTIIENSETNYVRVIGIIEENLKKSHIDGGKNFYETIVSIPREYGDIKDYIPVIISKKIKNRGVKKGDKVYVRGEVRKYKIPDGKNNIISQTSIFAYELSFVDDISIAINEVTLKGTIIDEPYYKVKDNKEYATLVLEVSRKYGQSDYISVFGVGLNAKRIRDEIHIGDEIEICGRIQSRYVLRKDMVFRQVFIKNFL